ncbi:MULTISPECIES: 2-oxo acid dehydrogenase subunit E2 [unclassified Nonomuraea]|uniref:2-oxo acid dehydrogenase subunit E2 n=1 Tax=unclassified Nonomuraea TaxID=2593643 RepID=UPI001376B0A5|nr:2-oxo acid dehydrogenase subunit E2 [Nonomuraea sp. KC401]NBE98019.1 pyruvate dehydrogenase [Nonomuraea sp. K271]
MAISVPRLNSNDIEYVVLEWLAGDGEEVTRGQPLVMVETSKAVEELTSPATGRLRTLSRAGAGCRIGEVIGEIVDGIATKAGPPAESGEAEESTRWTVTESARELLRAHGLTPAALDGLTSQIVRRADVERHLAGVAEGPRTLPPAQRAVARTVESALAVPAAFLCTRVDADTAAASTRRLLGAVASGVGVVEMTVAAVAAQLPAFPMMFATTVDGERFVPARDAHVAVTMDAGDRLQTPVLRRAGSRSLPQIAAELMRLRRAAVQGTLRERDQSGGNILVAVNTHYGVHLAVPLVFPGHTCAVSIGATEPELRPAPDGDIRRVNACTLGLAFDHRYVNGREAAAFLSAVRASIEAAGQ